MPNLTSNRNEKFRKPIFPRIKQKLDFIYMNINGDKREYGYSIFHRIRGHALCISRSAINHKIQIVSHHLDIWHQDRLLSINQSVSDPVLPATLVQFDKKKTGKTCINDEDVIVYSPLIEWFIHPLKKFLSRQTKLQFVLTTNLSSLPMIFKGQRK